jgi:hypothetical protein
MVIAIEITELMMISLVRWEVALPVFLAGIDVKIQTIEIADH